MKDLVTEDFTEFKWLPVRDRRLRAALPARGRPREDLPTSSTCPSSIVYFGALRPLVLRLQDVPVRAHPRPDGRGAGGSVHAADVRLQEARELRGLLVPAARLLRARPRRRSSSWPRSSSPGGSGAGSRPSRRGAEAARAAYARRAHGALAVLVLRCLAALPARPRRWRPSRPARSRDGPAAADDVSPLQARVDAAAPGATVEVEPGEYEGDLVLDRPLRLVGRGRPRLVGSGARQRRPRPRRRRDGRGLRHRRPRRRRPRAATPPASTSPPAHHDPRTPRSASRLRHLPARGERRASSSAARSAASRAGTPARRARGSTSATRRASASRTTRSWTCATASTSRTPRRGFLARQRGARRALRPALHVLGRQPVRGQHVRERGGGHRHHVLEAHRLPRATASCSNRGFASVGLLFQTCEDVAGRGQPDRGQRARRVHRGLPPDHVPRGNVVAGSDVAVVLYDSVRRPPLRGQLVRRQPDAARPGRPADGHRLHGQLLVRQRRARPRRRRPQRPALPAHQRLRPLPREPHRRRPALRQLRRRGDRRRRARVPGAAARAGRGRLAARAAAGPSRRAVASARAAGANPLGAGARARWPSAAIAARRPSTAAAAQEAAADDPLPRLREALRRAARRRVALARRRARRGGRAARAERLGQDDVAEGGGRAHPPDLGRR